MSFKSGKIGGFRGRRAQAAFGGARRRDEALFGKAAADVFENPEGLHEALQWQCDREFGCRPQFAVPAALNRFEAVEFDPYDAVDDTHLFQSVAEICSHFSSSLGVAGAPQILPLRPLGRRGWG